MGNCKCNDCHCKDHDHKKSSSDGCTCLKDGTPEEKELETRKEIVNSLYRVELLQKKQKILSMLQQLKGKVGRNDKCPCNSGKKFKKCCQRVLFEEYKEKEEPVTIQGAFKELADNTVGSKG